MSKYLFFDIDGTLRGKSREIHPKTISALKQLQRDGHRIFLCSGRSPASIKGQVVRDIDFDGIIGCAGGCIFVNGQYIYEHDMELSTLHNVLHMFEEHHILYSLETRDAIYQPRELTEYRNQRRLLRNKNHPEILKKFEKESQDYVIRPLEEFDKNTVGVPKLSFTSLDPVDFDSLRPILEETFYVVEFSRSRHTIEGEIIPKTCTKADGIQKILDFYHGNWEDTIAFGDSMNDYQMLQAVHTGVAYEHAPEELRQLAAYFFHDPDQAGIYQALIDMGLC